MLVRGRGSPKPGIVRDRYQKVCTSFDKPSAEIRKDNLKADENAEFTLGQGKIEDCFTRLKISDPFPQGSDEEKEILHRNILAKRDEVDLIILSHQFPRRGDQVSAVVMDHSPSLNFIRRGSEEEKSICLLRNIQDKGLVFLRILKKERSGCFRPDDEIQFFLCHGVRELLVDL
jgi:hypothetical protein